MKIVVEHLAYELLAGEAENSLRLRIHEGDSALAIHHEDCLGSVIGDAAGHLVLIAELLLGLVFPVLRHQRLVGLPQLAARLLSSVILSSVWSRKIFTNPIASPRSFRIAIITPLAQKR